MAKPLTIMFSVPFILCLLAAKNSQAYVESSNFMPKDWKASLGLGKEKMTILHFFFHDKVNDTAVVVASAPITASSPKAFFGALQIADEPLTEGIDPKSEEVGRAQGMVGYVDRNVRKLVMSFSFSFSKGEFKGSSLSMLTENPVTHPVRELAIVGGTGKFRLARGFAVAKTVKEEGLIAIIEYNVTLVHY